MLKNYFKIALRNLKRNKVYSLINILGLGLGIACAILIFTFIKYQLSFDTFHSNLDRIYLIGTGDGANVPTPLGEAFRNDYDFAEKVARIHRSTDQIISLPFSEDKLKFREEEGVAFAEPEFFDILNFPLVKGDKNTVLTEPNTAIITERLAKKYFGSQDPLGQIIRVDNKSDFRITGVLRDLPFNTDYRHEIYLSYSNLKDYQPWLASDESWAGVFGGTYCFLLLKQNVDSTTVNRAFPAFSEKYYNKKDAQNFQFKLLHISEIHLNPDLGGYVAKKNLWALSLIGLFLIITACVNFINLATAQALERSKEIGVRKVLGGYRMQLFWQFMAETALITIVSMILAFAFAHLMLPFINRLFDAHLRLNLFQDIYILIFLPILLLIVVFLSGSYPSLILAGFQPVQALKGKLYQRYVAGFSLRRGLVVVQFAISQLLIIGMIVVSNQMRYSRQADMGFEKEAVVILPVPDQEKSKISTLNSEISQIAGVENITFCNEAPVGPNVAITNIQLDSRTEKEEFGISMKAGDDRYISTFDLQIVAGRNLIRHQADTIREFLINETAVKKLNLSSNQDAIGKKATINIEKGTIVGVIKDFHDNSFHETIAPLCIANVDWYWKCAVKINPATLSPTLEAIENSWEETFPNHVYKYDFLDEQIARLYRVDYIILRLIQAFAAIAIIIGCLGLYGLVSFMAAQKTKEVGVRKVLGASVRSIVWLFGKEFTCLLLIAFVIAAPVAWWGMTNWLENFVYRIQIGAGIFALAILITLTVAVLTVGYRSVKAALTNPMKSLRSE